MSRTVITVLIVLVAPLALGGGLVAGAVASDTGATEDLEVEMVEHAEGLLPGGRVDAAEVTDTPALVAALRDHVQQTLLAGHSSDGHPVRMIVREYDMPSRHAESVSWYVEGLQLAPGWTAVSSARGVALNEAELLVDGQVVVVSAAARLEGSTLVVTPDTITVDGAPVSLADAPAPVRTALVPVSTPVPLPDAGAAVGEVWFDERGVAVALEAEDVDA